MLNFYLFTESCACCFIHDHYLSTLCYSLHSLSELVSHSLLPPFSSHASQFSFLHLTDFFSHWFQLLILFTPLIHFASCLGISGTGHGHLMSIFCHVFSCSLILALMHAHSTSSWMSHQLIHPQLSLLVGFFPSLVATCIFEPICNLHLTGHLLHMLMTYLLISLWTIILLAHLQHCIMIITHSVSVLPLWLSFSLRSAMVLLHFPSVAQPTLNSLTRDIYK